jgi:hypothetical protein
MAMTLSKDDWWEKAKEASAIISWFPTVILCQWQLETGNFKSANLLNNNNIAGQTWQPYMGEAMKGTARPANEGGYYIRYADPVDGYVDFIQKNPRYSHVKDASTEEDQIRAIAAAGWAADLEYADKLIDILNGNKAQGYVLDVKEDDTLELLEWEWKQLGDSLHGLYQKGLISDYNWADKAYEMKLTLSELAYLNMVILARQNGVEA